MDKQRVPFRFLNQIQGRREVAEREGKGERKRSCLDDGDFCSGIAIRSLRGRYIDDMRSGRISCKHFVYIYQRASFAAAVILNFPLERGSGIKHKARGGVCRKRVLFTARPRLRDFHCIP